MQIGAENRVITWSRRSMLNTKQDVPFFATVIKEENAFQDVTRRVRTIVPLGRSDRASSK